MKARISYSVGKRGHNYRDDVRTIQRALNQFILSPSPKLKVDGYAGKKTIGAIREFQKTHTDLRKIDGRVDPHGVTIKRLNGSIIFYPAHIQVNKETNVQENIFGSQENERLVELEVKKQGGTDKDFDDLIAFYKSSKTYINIARKGIGTANNAQKLVAFFQSFSKLKDAVPMLWQ